MHARLAGFPQQVSPTMKIPAIALMLLAATASAQTPTTTT